MHTVGFSCSSIARFSHDFKGLVLKDILSKNFGPPPPPRPRKKMCPDFPQLLQNSKSLEILHSGNPNKDQHKL